ncbi:MAG: PhoH family protein [Firmicutes bacterium]|nr:PhoH family protein [Bacillota bacterium]
MKENTEAKLAVQTNEQALSLFGEFDEHLKLLEKAFPVQILPRGTEITIYGASEVVARVLGLLRQLLAVVEQGNTITLQDVRYAIQMVKGEEELHLKSLFHDVILVTNRGKEIKPKTQGQKSYVDAIRRDGIVFGIGPAGTGKTYLAMAMAVQALKAKEVSRIILTRPAVEAGEKLGFLPGDLQEKVDPYLRPIYDALYDILSIDTFRKYVERGIIEVAPLAYMRGRTLDDSFILLDEAQNTTPEQMKMFLTRMGFSSKVVVTGDITQIDLPRGKYSGLEEAQYIFTDIPGISIVYLTKRDVVRHPLVQRVIKAYEDYEKLQKKAPVGEEISPS